MIRTKSEDAVSPVIGVMLMLVVTIVIAAVVAVFASGVGMDAEPAPATAVDVVDISDGYYDNTPYGYADWTVEHSVTLNCLYGDTLDLSKISMNIFMNRYGIEYIIEIPQKSIDGTISAGETKKLLLPSDASNIDMISEGYPVEKIVIFYGNHKIAEKEHMTVSCEYRVEYTE